VKIIGRDFFARPTLLVARELLGQTLVREVAGQRLSGRIVETEAYIGPQDSANHASRGRTSRTEVMFGLPGHAYVYLIYGMYSMLNVVTEHENFPAAVLIRALEPIEGIEIMRARRHSIDRPVQLTNGPGKLCQALGIDGQLHNWDLTLGRQLWFEPGNKPPDTAVSVGLRVGIDYARPEDRQAPWRFWLRDNKFVSR
jgi:DNA-3-methyladenine glycosylase